MKKLSLIVALFVCISASAQISVGSRENPSLKSGKFSDEDMDNLKKTTTLFTLQTKDYDHLADFEKVIAEVWKVTKFKIIKPEEVKKYELLEGYSLFTFGGFYTEHRGIGAMHYVPEYTLHMTYDLSIPEVGKKGKVNDHQYYVRMILSLTAQGMRSSASSFSRKKDDALKTYMYKNAKFDSWGAGFLKGYLITINDILMKGETRYVYAVDVQTEALKPLKNDTLYVPDYINERYSAFSGKGHEGDKDEESLKESYSYPLRLLPAEEINQMLLTRTTPFYYLVFVRGTNEKNVNVYHSTKGLLYADSQTLSFNFKYNDLTSIQQSLK